MFKRNDWMVGIVSVLLGVFVLLRSTTWQEQTSLDTAGPGGFPTILAWGIIIIGIIHLVGAYFTPKLQEDKQEKWLKEFNNAKPVLLITLVSAVYILLIESFGYLIATPLLIFAILWVVKVRDIKKLLLTSIATTVILYLTFGIALKVKLPMGFLNGLF